MNPLVPCCVLTPRLRRPQSTTPQMVEAELASGKAYVHTGTDKYGRPAIVIRTKLHKTGQYPITGSKRLAAYLIDTAIARIPPGGEQIVGIFDLRGFTFASNADFQFAAFMVRNGVAQAGLVAVVEAFFEFYPRRVGQVLFVDAPWVFFPAWEVIKPLMRKYAALSTSPALLTARELRPVVRAVAGSPQSFGLRAAPLRHYLSIMSDSDEESCSSEGSDSLDDLDDVPLNVARPNGRYEQSDPPTPMTSRAPASGFSRLGPSFTLKLPLPVPDDRGVRSPEAEGGLSGMRSEPTYMPETSRGRPSPSLSLALTAGRSTSAAYASEDAAGPRSRRGPPLKPPMLHLSNPASASPVPSTTPMNAFGEASGAAGEGPGSGEPHSAAPLRIELVSSAFVLQSTSTSTAAGGGHQGMQASTSERVAESCSTRLGIAQSDLRFFELRPLEAGAIPDGCNHVGVMIAGSIAIVPNLTLPVPLSAPALAAFSLSALEDMLARSKRDAQLVSMLEAAHQHSAQHAGEAKQHAERAASQAAELSELKERLRGMEQENQHLREQLQRTDEHRHLLSGTIRTIKKEFEDLKGSVGGGVEALGAQQLSLQHLSLGPGGQAGGTGR
ncbi:CRAL-TRIO domain-containing protein C3H8.02 [Tetrabaena socialis]|uniref:CRAL-TRIO domain-containing protein C3H8.02 n=1 Tax=Tetrabaena socialis TaxID=47790 RepID=A0A2J8AKD0_9CHLO|nr:CRAL-TRIO domain-containing protein C3H8.02 [Tetrabaena socialis]|eukprot:PNH12969.1 CRAL-TRIO domain-containing protein C3H8.02 [Tetrabaena socialis]